MTVLPRARAAVLLLASAAGFPGCRAAAPSADAPQPAALVTKDAPLTPQANVPKEGTGGAPPRPGAALPPLLPKSAVAAPAAAPPPPVPLATRGADGGAGGGGKLARAGGRDVTAADVGDFVVRWNPEFASAAVEWLVLSAVVESEARREGVSVPPALLSAATDRAVAKRLRDLRLEYGPGADPERVLTERFGRSAAELRADVEGRLRVEMLRDRLVRLDQLREDGADIRVLVVATKADALAAAAQLREGADATLLARRLSVAPPAAPPPLRRADVPDPALREAIFSAATGAVLEPASFQGDDPERPGVLVTAWQVFKVVRAWKASAAPWVQLAPGVETSIATAPVTEEETRRWQARAWVRSGVLAGGAASPRGTSVPPAESGVKRSPR